MTEDYDLLVIGAGSGGLAAAKRAASYGARVAIVEQDRVGGTCVVRGCIPKKLMVYAAQCAHWYTDAQGYGWDASLPRFRWSVLRDRIAQEVQRLSQIHCQRLQQAGVKLIQGKARFSSPHGVEVGEVSLRGDRILIATGSEAVVPDLPGIEHAITSRDLFKLPDQPQRLAIIGGGYIGVEFAGVFNALGTEVIQLVRGPSILREFDADLRHHLQAAIIHRGVHLRTHTSVEALHVQPAGIDIQLSKADPPITVDAAVLFATGRAPNTAGLQLEKAGLSTQAGAIAVNHWGQTQQPHIYAVGDVTDQVMLTPVAIAQGRAFADTVFGSSAHPVSYEAIPTAIFSQPEAASVGLSEAQAQQKLGEQNIQVYRSYFRPLFYSLAEFDEKTFLKLVVDRQSQRVLGVHMVGKDAAEIIQSVAIALTMGATKADFDRTMPLHPSTAEELVTMEGG
ncbi:glutathione-disulfide reductase [Lyngbya confervoides]|uniref:Glutathione-disulfide reductase n=1 Tax=Lyngbya confervoides BDU141951 TaxID=1574623 RepID=A0ABD4T021_9CYAN|nr:glutathione-disulfide reductase [Lyngbya confervoides]MCM1982056.1 glutathione-disulfide reductase [Lyngbya confervoides BDU141951]